MNLWKTGVRNRLLFLISRLSEELKLTALDDTAVIYIMDTDTYQVSSCIILYGFLPAFQFEFLSVFHSESFLGYSHRVPPKFFKELLPGFRGSSSRNSIPGILFSDFAREKFWKLLLGFRQEFLQGSLQAFLQILFLGYLHWFRPKFFQGFVSVFFPRFLYWFSSGFLHCCFVNFF